jgi:hypothetical protein
MLMIPTLCVRSQISSFHTSFRDAKDGAPTVMVEEINNYGGSLGHPALNHVEDDH